MNKVHLNFLAAAIFAVLAGCALFGGPKAETFNEKLATGYVTVTAVRQEATSLLTSGVISADDAQNIQDTADNARAGLDIARNLGELEGADKLSATLLILTQLETYVATKVN